MAIIIVKNNSGSDVTIRDIGSRLVSNGEQINMGSDYPLEMIYNSVDLKAKVSSEDLVINDGTNDLSVNEALRYLSIQTEYRSTPSLEFSFGNNLNLYISSNSTSYEAVSQFVWIGSDLLGVAKNAKAILATESEMSIRIYDFTNGNVIAEKTGISDTDLTLHDLGDIANIPTGEAIFEIQLRQDGNRPATISALSLQF